MIQSKIKAVGLKAVLMMGAFLSLGVSPANACVEIYKGGCAMEAEMNRQHTEEQNRMAYEFSQAQQQPEGPPLSSLTSRAPPPKPASYFTVWWHPDARDVWAVWNHDHLYDAGFAAYSTCMTLMGGGCELLTEGSNMSVAIARDPNGRPVFGKDKVPEKARALLLDYCTQHKIACEITHEFTAKLPKKGRPVAEAFFPGSSAVDPAKFHFAAGYGRNMFHIRDKIWVAAGQPSALAAKKTGGDICWSADGCGTNDGTRFEIDSGYVLIFKNKYGNGDFMDYLTGTDKTALAKQATAACQKRSNSGCTHGVFLDPRVPFKGEINYSMLQPWAKLQQAAGTLASNQQQVPTGPTGTGPGSGMSYSSKPMPGGGAFTAQAQVKGVDNIWKFMIWSVSGGVDGPSTSAAALAECQKDSQRECEVWSLSQDTKVALYIDDDYTVRLGKVRYAVDPVPIVNKACKSEKTTCKIVRVIDSHAPLMERVEVR